MHSVLVIQVERYDTPWLDMYTTEDGSECINYPRCNLIIFRLDPLEVTLTSRITQKRS